MPIKTQVASGNLSNPSIWSGGQIPGDGDRIVNYDGWDLTIDQDATIGTNAQSGKWLGSQSGFYALATADISAAIWVRSGTLTISDNVTLTLKGDLISQNSEVTIGAGVTINIDASGADTTGLSDSDFNRFYVIDAAIDYGGELQRGRITINGTAENKSTVQCIGGASFFTSGHTVIGYPKNGSGCIDATYTHFKNFGVSPVDLGSSAEYSGSRMQASGVSFYQIRRGWTPQPSHEVSNTTHAEDIRFRMVNCILEDTTGIEPIYGLNSTAARTQITFDGCTSKKTKFWMRGLSFIKFEFTTDVSDFPSAASVKVADVNAVPFRIMKNCSWDRSIIWNDSAHGWQIENNVFACGFDVNSNVWTGHGAISFRDNIVVRSNAWDLASSKPDYRTPASWINNNYAGHYGYQKISNADIGFQSLPYGTGERDPTIPQSITDAAGSLGVKTYVKGNYFIEDHSTDNPHVLSVSGGNGNGAHIIIDNIWEVVNSDGQGESVFADLEFSENRTTPTEDTGAVYYVGNLLLPSANQTESGCFWIGMPNAGAYHPNYDIVSLRGQPVTDATYMNSTHQINGTGRYFYGHLPCIFTNNTAFVGITEGAINVSEHGYSKDTVRYVKNNIFWDSTTRASQAWALGDVSNRSHPDLVLPENVDYNIKINMPYSAETSTDYSFTVASQSSPGATFYNENGYRALDLSNPDDVYTSPEGVVSTKRRLNAFGINDHELSITDTALIPFVNHVVGSARYAESITGNANAALAWQSYSKEFDWSDGYQNGTMTRAGLREYTRRSMAPVYTGNGFNSQLDGVYQSPTNYIDPNLSAAEGNPLGTHGALAYQWNDDQNALLKSLAGLYETNNVAYPGALPFSLSNRPPVHVADSIAVTMNEAKTISYADLLSNDSDPDGNSFTITSFSNAGLGSVVANSAAGNVIYTPAADSTEDDSFTYTVTDSLGQQSSGIVTLLVSSLAPVAQSHTNSSGVGNAFVTISKASLLSGATDADGNDANITFHGFAARSSRSGSDNIQAVGPDNIGYQAPSGVSGVDSFTYTVIDEKGDIGQGTYTIVLSAVESVGGSGSGPGNLSVISHNIIVQKGK